MAADRSEWVEDENGNRFRWPWCVVPGCVNRICLAKGETRFCWPHSDSGQTVSQMIEVQKAKAPA